VQSNVTSLNLSLKKKVKTQQKITKLCSNCGITDKKIITCSIKKKGQNTTKKITKAFFKLC
jgi:hypothetical protein